MGIILEKSKLVFDELIGQSSFDEIFKNSIRDYYTYGFKSYDQFSKGSQIIKDRWKVFSKVLGEKWYFEKRKNGRNQIVLKTNPLGMDNPVDDLYFLHNLSKIGDYLNYLIDLDCRSRVRGGLEQLPVGLDELETVEGKNGSQSLVDADSIEYAIISNWQYLLENGHGREEIPFPIRINRQMNIWSRNTRYIVYSAELLDDSNKPRFFIENANYLFDVLPITKMEARWLKTVLEDPLAKIFLNSEQITTMLETLKMAPYEVASFTMEAINYFDRYNLEGRFVNGIKKITQEGRHTEREISFLKTINQAIQNEQMLRIVFKNWKGEKRHINCAPVWIEYSRRDDIFRLFGVIHYC